MTASTSSTESDCRFNITTNVSEDADFSVNLRLPKFSNDCTDVDLLSVLETKIDKDDIRYLGKLRYSNEWQVTFNSKTSRDQLLEVGKFVVNGKKCVVYPCGRQAVGRIHWLPIDVPEEVIKDILRHFGDISKFGCEKLFPNSDSPHSLIRFFILNLRTDCSSEDIPHFISVNKHQGLVVVKGRDPMCLECKEVGHKKKNCPVIQKRRDEKAAKSSKKSVKKSKSLMESVLKNLSSEANASGASANVSSKSKKNATAKSPQSAGASASGVAENSAVQDPKESINSVANDVKRLQQLMNMFSLRMNEVLANSSLDTSNNTAAQSAVEHSESIVGDGELDASNKQTKKKKKKKSRTSDNYDLVAAEVVSNNTSSPNQNSSKSSVDSGIASNEHSTYNSSINTDTNGNTCSKDILQANVNSSDVSNSPHIDNVNIPNKKKKKKKKSSGSTIPGLTQP